MQYMQKGGFQKNSLMRLTLMFTALLLTFFVATNFLIYFEKMNVTPASVNAYYNGSEEGFRPARTYGSMLEVTHGHMAMMAMVLLMLTHLVIFAPFVKRTKILFICFTFLSALADEGGGWLVRFVHPEFAWLKIAGFIGLQTCLIFLLSSLAVFLIRSKSDENKKDSSSDDSDEIPDSPQDFSKKNNGKAIGKTIAEKISQ